MISISNLRYRYGSKIELFRGLNMELLPGKIYGLLGKNGAGKSTLIKNIGGMLFPTTGRCLVFGKEPRRRQTSFLQNTFYIPEECYLPRLTIREFIRTYAPYYPSFDLAQYQAYLDEFGIASNRHLHALSFGQKKKALIGFAISANTRVLILDEPTNGLDIPSKITFRNMINDSFKKDRIVIISSHQVRDLDELITSLIIIDKGAVLLHQDKEKITSRLHFQLTDRAVPAADVLYQERVSGGWASLAVNNTGKKNYLDIELLFNAVLEKGEAFSEYLTAEAQAESI